MTIAMTKREQQMARLEGDLHSIIVQNNPVDNCCNYRLPGSNRAAAQLGRHHIAGLKEGIEQLSIIAVTPKQRAQGLLVDQKLSQAIADKLFEIMCRDAPRW